MRERDASVATAFKAKQEAAGDDCCAICRWRPPRVLRDLAGDAMLGALHAHHVIPVACGGADDETNLLLVCPNHHVIAHRIGSMVRFWGQEFLDWTGPLTPFELMATIDLLTLPDEFRRLAKLGYRFGAYLELVHEEAVALDVVADVRINRSFTVERGLPPRFFRSRATTGATTDPVDACPSVTTSVQHTP